MPDEGLPIPTRLLSGAAIGSEAIMEHQGSTFRGLVVAVTGHAVRNPDGHGHELAMTVILAVATHDTYGNHFDAEVTIRGDGTETVILLGAPEAPPEAAQSDDPGTAAPPAAKPYDQQDDGP